MRNIGFVKTGIILSMVFGMILIIISGFITGMNVAEAVMEYSGLARFAYISVTWMIVSIVGTIGIVLVEMGYDVLSILKEES